MLHKFKKCLAFFLVIAMTVSSLTVALAGDGEGEPTPLSASITIEAVTAVQGDEATVTVSIADNPGFHAFSYAVTYDSEVLSFVSADTELSGSFEGKENTEGESAQVDISYESDNAEADVADNGVLFTMKFNVLTEAAVGDSALALTGTMTNLAAADVSFTPVDGKVTVTAREYTVTIETDGNGDAKAEKETYHYGDTVNLTASPNLNCSFKTWMSADGITFKDATAEKTSFTMPAKNVTIHASFVDNTLSDRTVTLTCTPENAGTATADKEFYEIDENVHLDAVPNDGYYFKEWQSEDITIGTANTPSLDFNMPSEDVAVTAVFEPLLANRYSITPNATYGGTVSCNSTENYFSFGSTVRLTAAPMTNYAFKEWQFDSSMIYVPDKTDPVIEFSMPRENIQITAVFEYNPGKLYNVTVQSQGGGTAESVKRQYAAGERVVITATPRLGYLFYSWDSVDDVTFLNPSASSTSFIMPARDVTIVASFAVNTGIIGGGGTGGGGGTSSGGNTNTSVPTNNIFTVNFDSQGGTPVSSVTVYNGGLISAPTPPTREGYEFGGWYTQAACVDAYNFSVAVSKSFTLYARWLPLEETERFFDVKRSDWFYDPVHALVDKGIINGITYNKFAPNDSVTRAQFTQMLALASGADLSSYTCEFEDVTETDWFYPAIAWANSVGVVNGITETTFEPNALISRQDMTVMLSRYIENVSKSTYEESTFVVPFADDAAIADYARDAVMQMKKYNIVGGKLDNRFAPRESATRAEAAKMIYNMIELAK